MVVSIDDWRRPGPAARQRRIDLLIGLLALSGALFNVVLARSLSILPAGGTATTIEEFAWAAAITIPIIWRRSHPEIVLIIIAVIFIAGQVRRMQENQYASGMIFAAIFAVGAWGQDRLRARWLRIAVIAAMFLWLGLSWLLRHGEVPLPAPPGRSATLPVLSAAVSFAVLTNILAFGFAYLFGETAWLSARRQQQLEVQANQLRAAQAMAEERAVFGERVRIARELHDVVAHHVSVMGIQASAARRSLDRDPVRARTALTAVEHSSRTAVDELRRMLGALRAPGAPSPALEMPSAAAGLDHLEELTSRVRAAGLAADFAVFGRPAPVPDSVSLAAYRIVQEAVTNTLKHARATRIDIRVRYLARELEIDVTDDGRGGSAGNPHGLGLIGMRERAVVHEGTVEAGPRPSGGFRVRARFPLSVVEHA